MLRNLVQNADFFDWCRETKKYKENNQKKLNLISLNKIFEDRT